MFFAEGGSLLPCPPVIQNSFPSKINCSISHWHSIVYSDFISLPYTGHILSVINLTDSDIYYQTFISRGSGKIFLLYFIINNISRLIFIILNY